MRLLLLLLFSTFFSPFAAGIFHSDRAIASEKPGFIDKIRMARQDGFYRVVIDLGKKLQYSHSLNKDKNLLVIDFPNAMIASRINFTSLRHIKDKTIDSISYQKKSGYNRKLLLQLRDYKRYHLHQLHKPERIVIDIFDADAKAEAKKVASKKVSVQNRKVIKPKSIVRKTRFEQSSKMLSKAKASPAPKQPSKKDIDSLIQQISPKSPIPAEIIKTEVKVIPKGLINRSELTIVIDPGHGGKDSGAVGLYGLQEKDIVLDIGLRLRTLLIKKYKCKIVMTRATDVFIPLEERTNIAESNNASLFISIHVNATKRKLAKGIETYFLSPARSESALETQARENMVSGGKNNDELSDLEIIFASMKNTQKVNESSLLAGAVQNSIVSDVKQRYGYAKNLGVKSAMFVVLFWASMPSVLIETSFVTNPQDARRLRTKKFRQTVANSIYKGIDKYLKQATIEYNVKK